MPDLRPEPADNHTDPHHAHLHRIPPATAQTIFDRLNAALDPAQAGPAGSRQKHALDALGSEIWQWRLQQGYTRGFLADKLQMDMNRLTCLENGIAQSGDITITQLWLLQTLLPGSQGERLGKAIGEYLALLEP